MFWIFAFIFCLVLAFLVGADIKYYYDHFHRKDKDNK